MIKGKRFTNKTILSIALLLCLCLVLKNSPLPGTLAYVTSSPKTVVNTFEGETVAASEEESETPGGEEKESSTPETSETAQTETTDTKMETTASTEAASKDSSSSEGKESTSQVKTGDNSLFWLYVVALMVSVVGLILIWTRKEKKDE